MSNWWYGEYCYLFTIALMYSYMIIFRCNQSFLIDMYVFGTMPDFVMISVGICRLSKVFFLNSKTKYSQLLTKDKAWR